MGGRGCHCASATTPSRPDSSAGTWPSGSAPAASKASMAPAERGQSHLLIRRETEDDLLSRDLG
jgi:hypothetical protein